MFDNYIVKGIGGFYYVKTGGSLVECKPKGIFRKKRITPVAGDIVRLETDGGAPVIADILPRKNVFVRPPVANVDQFFIVVSTVQPVPSTLVIDKLSAIAVDKGAQPVLVITKTDLQDAHRVQPLACPGVHTQHGNIRMGITGGQRLRVLEICFCNDEHRLCPFIHRNGGQLVDDQRTGHRLHRAHHNEKQISRTRSRWPPVMPIRIFPCCV